MFTCWAPPGNGLTPAILFWSGDRKISSGQKGVKEDEQGGDDENRGKYKETEGKMTARRGC